METTPYSRKTVSAIPAVLGGLFGAIASLLVTTITATTITTTNLTSTYVTSTRFMSATTSTFANNIGTEMDLSRTAVTTTIDLSNGRTCFKTKGQTGTVVYLTMNDANNIATSTSPCSF